MPLGVEPHKLVRSERVKAIGVPRFVTELDLEGVVGKDLNDRTDLTCRKAKLRHVREECYGVEKQDR
jgi:hypothetical protein